MNLDYKTIATVNDWFFSDKDISEYDECEQKIISMARWILSTHGANGKFAEILVRHKYGMEDPSGIHGWDGYLNDRPIEIKVETSGSTAKMNCMGSFSPNKKQETKSDIWLRDRPMLYSIGICGYTFKCIYVINTDTQMLPEMCDLFTALKADSPRISFTQFRNHSDAYTCKYFNEKVFSDNNSQFNGELRDYLTNANDLTAFFEMT